MANYIEIKEKNSILNLDEYRSNKIVLQSYPRYILVELTRGCNLICPMCRSSKISFKDKTMNLSTFDKIKPLFKYCEIVDLRGWGESLILPNIQYFIESALDYSVKLRFVTNLSFKNDRILDLLAKHDSIIDVSLDSASPEILKKVRGGANLNQIISNLEFLTRSYNKYNANNDNLSIITTLQKDTIDGLPSLVELAYKVNIHNIRLFSITTESDSLLSILGQEERIDSILNSVRQKARSYGISILMSSKIGNADYAKYSNNPCIHPWTYCTFSYDGRFGFCDHLIGDGNDHLLIGNINDFDFNVLWNSEELKNLRKEHLTKRRTNADFFSQCSWCYQNKFIDFEHRFDSSLLGYKVSI